MPTKTGDKIRIIVLGTGPDAETARLIAESDADVALAKQFTKTVTHLVVDDTVKPTEARLTKAQEAGVPVLSFAEFKALLVAGAEDEVEEVVEAELEEAPAETPAAVVEVAAETEVVDEAPDAGPEAAEETAAATEPEPVAEPVAADEPAPAEPVSESKPAPVAEPEPVEAPVAEAIDEPEAAAADPDQAVPSQADAPAIENDADKSGSKPGLLAKIKSIFGLTGARK
ncbi:hypothetical protein [Glycomyces harbinensis]|uniref:BRCT domain-containing protein n=1 Tax=Glycomyces harbinensis TaxID=58114 RepID=A0A1G6Y3Q1_9ACTN|nr:hypothetical protein [Glycomyces harbinensis]SDD84236.1 hypothetical protein SAMN05216270_10878 [Glycomyces harbinensis]